MKYIEELKYGQFFSINELLFILTSDYKIDHKTQKNKHMCIQVSNGSIQWLYSDQIVDNIPIFYQDKDNVLHQIEWKNYDSKN